MCVKWCPFSCFPSLQPFLLPGLLNSCYSLPNSESFMVRKPRQNDLVEEDTHFREREQH